MTDETIDTDNVYPSLNELMPKLVLARLPYLLADEISERYAKLGPKYMTKEKYFDGRFINGCMYKSSVQDAIEEIVDAVFNTLVWMFKGREQNEMSENMWAVMHGLIEIYSVLMAEKELEDAAASA